MLFPRETKTNPLAPASGERCAGTRSRGPVSWGCDRAGAHKHAGNCGAASRSGVASKHNSLGNRSALRGRRVRDPRDNFYFLSDGSLSGVIERFFCSCLYFPLVLSLASSSAPITTLERGFD